ncbi:MAG: hypothetical protein JWO08_274 [Verrucomicrobiaceae bacterium]|nr:hypothetical protein [Verrucomicrobiaceae bacterium]
MIAPPPCSYRYGLATAALASAVVAGLLGQRLWEVSRRMKRAEELQQREASLLSEAQRLAGVGSWVWNPATDEVSWSDEMFRIYRRNPERGAARYKEAEKLYPPDAWGMIDAAVEKTFTEGVPYQLDCAMVREDGSMGWVVSRGEAVKDASGRIICLRGTVQDITERKQTEDALRDSEDKFRSAFAKAAIGMAMTDMEGRYVEANDAYSLITGYSREELTAVTFHEIVHPDDLESNLATMKRLMAGEITDFVMQNRYLRRSGTVVWVRKSVSLVRDQLGSPRRIIALIEDVTVRKRIEDEICLLNEELEQRVQIRTEELEAANKELEAFSYTVSHDLRAPLRAVDGFSKALLEDCGESLSEDGRHYISVIRKGARNMGALIDDLLTFSRLSRLPLQKRTIETNRLVHDVLSELGAHEEAQTELRIADLPPCEGDPALLKQVWLNLLANALKYSRDRSPSVIEVGATQKNEDEAWVYHVRDNGAGFDMRYAPKLFGVFQRLHRADEYEGTGVGLAIVQRVIHRHGGRIWAEAQVDKGATFYFTLTS